MTAVIYKLTRSDGLEYIGITTNLSKRVSEHKKTERFESGIVNVEVLLECLTYEEAEILEGNFIAKYNTYHDGLNMTPAGKGRSENCKFNTFGLKHSPETRKKMSDNHWSKKGGTSWHKGKIAPYSQNTTQKWSKTRKGKCFGTRKITPSEGQAIIQSFAENSINFSSDFIDKFVKKTQKGLGLPLEELKSSNGLPLSLKTLYCFYYSEQYGVTSSAIRRILDGKVLFSKGWYDDQETKQI